MSRFAPHKPTANNPRATSSTFCQKCLQRGHFTYQCKNARPYVSRPSRTQLLHKPNALAQLKEEGMSNIDVPEEFLKKSGTANEILTAKEKARQKGDDAKKRKRSKSTTSEESSGSSESSVSDSESSSSGSSDSESSDSGPSADSRSSSRSRARENRRKRTRRQSRSFSTEEELDEDRRSRR